MSLKYRIALTVFLLEAVMMSFVLYQTSSYATNQARQVLANMDDCTYSYTPSILIRISLTYSSSACNTVVGLRGGGSIGSLGCLPKNKKCGEYLVILFFAVLIANTNIGRSVSQFVWWIFINPLIMDFNVLCHRSTLEFACG